MFPVSRHWLPGWIRLKSQQNSHVSTCTTYVQSWSIRKGTTRAVINSAPYSASLLDMPDTRHVFEIRRVEACHVSRKTRILIFARNYIFKVAFLLPNSANVCASSGCKVMMNRIGFISSNLKLIRERTRVEPVRLRETRINLKLTLQSYVLQNFYLIL